MTKSTILDLSVVQRTANLAILLGIVGIFQGGSEPVFIIGSVLLVIGVAAYLLSLIWGRIGWHQFAERAIVLVMMVSILGMLQPWNIQFYETGFYGLAIATLAFIIISHITVAEEEA